jgi:FlaG/FlaF family flagellin (archaellin)
MLLYTVYILCCPKVFAMNSYIIATTALIATAVIIAATIAVPVFSNSAYAIRNGPVAQNSRNSVQNENAQAGLVNANVPVDVQASLQGNCAINVLSAC